MVVELEVEMVAVTVAVEMAVAKEAVATEVARVVMGAVATEGGWRRR